MLGVEIASKIQHKFSHRDMASTATRLTAYQRAEDMPIEDARALLCAHLTWGHEKLRGLGAPDFDVMRHVDRFFAHLDCVLPPKGAYFLAHDRDGLAVGTGALRRMSETMAEMKHLYVRPNARGSGLGAKLIAARIEAARALGIKVLVADTFCGNDPMIRLYHRFGFGDSAPYDSAVSEISPELTPHLCYFRMML